MTESLVEEDVSDVLLSELTTVWLMVSVGEIMEAEGAESEGLGGGAVATAASTTSCTLGTKDVGLDAMDRLGFPTTWLVSEAPEAGRRWVDVVSIPGAANTLSTVCSESVVEGVTYGSTVRVAVSVTVTYLGRRWR